MRGARAALITAQRPGVVAGLSAVRSRPRLARQRDAALSRLVRIDGNAEANDDRKTALSFQRVKTSTLKPTVVCL